MSLLVRAALLGGLAYVVTRAVRNRQLALDFSRSEARRLGSNYENEQNERWSPADQPSTGNA